MPRHNPWEVLWEFAGFFGNLLILALLAWFLIFLANTGALVQAVIASAIVLFILVIFVMIKTRKIRSRTQR